MDTKAALAVNSPETLESFLQYHRKMAEMKYVSDIEWVSVDKDFKITHVKFMNQPHQKGNE